MRKPIPADISIHLQDGTAVRMLRQHLASGRSLTPAQYRAMWDLPPDYPLVAPSHPGQPAAASEPAREGEAARQDPHANPKPEKPQGEQRIPARE